MFRIPSSLIDTGFWTQIQVMYRSSFNKDSDPKQVFRIRDILIRTLRSHITVKVMIYPNFFTC
jgi:hypothetical protein